MAARQEVSKFPTSVGRVADTPMMKRIGRQLLWLFPAFLLPLNAGTAGSPPVSAGPPLLRSISIAGNNAVSAREILTWIAMRESTTVDDPRLEEDLRAIRRGYAVLGYLAADVSVLETRFTADSAWVDVTLEILEGRQSVVGRIDLVGNRALISGEILEQFETRAGDPLRQAMLEEDLRVLLGRYEALGYAFARCLLDSVASRAGPHLDSLDLSIRVDEGERLRIEELRVDGVRLTDPAVVTREARIRPGEVYDPSRVTRIKDRLTRLNIFASVEEPELFLRNGKGGLLLKVREGNTNTFDGVLGYLPPDRTGNGGTFTGLAAISMRNLFGTGRKLSIRWQRDDRFTQELQARYTEPWLFGFPLNLGAGFLQRQQDSAYVRRTIDVSADLLLSELMSLGAIVVSQGVIPSEDSAAARVGRSSALTIGADVRYDSRDDPYVPLAGTRFRADYHYGRKRIEGVEGLQAGSTGSLQRLGLDFEIFLATFPRQVAALGVHGRQVSGPLLEESDMERLGGARSLRGYREDQFVGSIVGWSNLEYRLVLSRKSYLYGFLDGGYYARSADDERLIPRTEEFLYGYGAGLTIDTPLGILGISLAFGKGDSFANGKVHVRIVNEF